MAERALLAAIIAILITALARRAGTLNESGQWAAIGCGIAAAIGGWGWAILLVIYFAAATAVSALGAREKAERCARAVPQVPYRNATQVLANGAAFSILAAQAGPAAGSVWGLAAAGALAASSADTWGTEIGTLWGGTPRSIITAQRLTPGMSGGVTPIGFAATIVGALIVAGAGAWLFNEATASRFLVAAVAGGVAGAAADSLLGATLQARRWCDHCKEWTERRVHPCSYRTVHARGYRWMSNDVVNAASTLVGAAVAATLWVRPG
jgi:uncharacterized protein (TIGR00297 family)